LLLSPESSTNIRLWATHVRKTPHPLLPSLPLLSFKLSPLVQSRQNVSILTITTPLASPHDKHIKTHHKLHRHSESVYKHDKTLQSVCSKSRIYLCSLCTYPFSPPNIYSHEMDILHSLLGSNQESLKSTEATLTSSHLKTSFNQSMSTLQLLSLTTCDSRAPRVGEKSPYSITFCVVGYFAYRDVTSYKSRIVGESTLYRDLSSKEADEASAGPPSSVLHRCHGTSSTCMHT
jgi:hypothetical protein